MYQYDNGENKTIKKFLSVFIFGGGLFFSNSLLHGAHGPLLEKVKMASRILRPGYVSNTITNRGCQFVVSRLCSEDQAESKNDFKHFLFLVDRIYKSGSPQVKLVTRVIHSVEPVSYGTFSLIAAGCNTCIDKLDGRFSHRTNTQRFLHHLISLSVMQFVYTRVGDSIVQIADNRFQVVINTSYVYWVVGGIGGCVADPYIWKAIEYITNFRVNSESENKKRAALSGDLGLKKAA